MENLKIKKRFKIGLENRFDPKNITESRNKIGYTTYKINYSCELCKEHQSKQFPKTLCGGCPFTKFEGPNGLKSHRGCYVFLESLVGHLNFTLHVDYLVWHEKNDEVISELNKIREKALKHIEWI